MAMPNSFARTKLTWALLVASLAAIGAAFYFVRPPGPGQVYRHRSDQYGFSGSTALVLRNGDCLVLSQTEADIGRAEAPARSENRLYAVAGTDRIRSGSDDSGPYLIDTRTGLRARPGDAIDAEVLFRPKVGSLKDTLAAGWLLDDRCGSRLAVVFSISRVHR
jgi:hypothetical protein